MIISQPDVTFNIQPATQTVGNNTHRALIIGQMTSAGTATSGALQEDIQNDNAWNTLFGADSHVARMITQFRRINGITPLDVIAYDDNGSGTAATGELELSGTATAAGTLLLTLGSNYDHKLEIAVAAGDTATTVGDAIDTAVAADTTLQVSSSNSTGTVTFTAGHKGTLGNEIAIKIENLPAGLTGTITGFSGGATNPTITGLAATIDNRRYQTIVFPGSWAISTIDTEMDTRWNVTNNILDGMVVTCKMDTYANLASFATTFNQQQLVVIGNPKVSATDRLVGGAIVEFSDNIAAQFAAIRALRLTDGANISNYVIGNNGLLDVTGGPAIASLPFFNTPFPYLPLVKQGDGLTRTQIEALQLVGVSVLGNNIARNSIIAGEIVTTYRTDSAGNTDTSFKYVEYVDTASNIREYFFNNARAQYAQTRLTDGALIPGRNMANADSIKAFMVGLYDDLSQADYVLTRAGEEYLKYFKNNLNVAINLATGTVTITMTVPIVVQLRTILATFKVAFNTNV